MPLRPSFFLPLAMMWFGHLVVDTMIGILPVYKTLAHLDLAIAGLISGLCAFAGEGMQVLFGSLSDRGYRKFIIFAGILGTTAAACMAFTTSYLIIFVLYLITCIGSGAFHPSAASCVGSLHAPKNGLFLSIFASGGALGMGFSQIAFTQMYQISSWHVLWLVVPSLLLICFGCFSPVGYQPKQVASSASHFDIKTIKAFFCQQPMRTLYFTQVCNAVMLWGTIFLLPDLLNSRGYEPWIAFGGGHCAFILGSAIMMIPAGYLADRFSARVVLFCGILLSLVGFYTLLFFPLLDNISTLSLLFVTGGAIGIGSPVAVALGTRLAPTQKGMVGAFLMGLVWCVSETIGQSGGGFLATCFESDAPAKALAILGVFFFFGGIAAFQLPQKEEAIPALEIAH